LKYQIKLQELPLGKYNEMWFWLYKHDIGDMKKQADDTGGYVDVVNMDESEALLFTLKWL